MAGNQGKHEGCKGWSGFQMEAHLEKGKVIVQEGRKVDLARSSGSRLWRSTLIRLLFGVGKTNR
jgi:hypothetical protein